MVSRYYSFHDAVEQDVFGGRRRCVVEQVRIEVEVVREIVLVSLHVGHLSTRMAQLVHDDVFDRLDQLIDAGMVRWIKSRPDHYVIMPQRDVPAIELATEIKKQLRL